MGVPKKVLVEPVDAIHEVLPMRNRPETWALYNARIDTSHVLESNTKYLVKLKPEKVTKLKLDRNYYGNGYVGFVGIGIHFKSKRKGIFRNPLDYFGYKERRTVVSLEDIAQFVKAPMKHQARDSNSDTLTSCYSLTG